MQRIKLVIRERWSAVHNWNLLDALISKRRTHLPRLQISDLDLRF